ncbi:hypothetical protein ACFRDV_22360 [Streptomyces fagopyri]|uniref:zinc finger domain-containing protein n=1 Tax=Streptomyces fagopyri TaxID=2662397 RepID=UPI0036CF071D
MTSRAEARNPELSKPCPFEKCRAQPKSRCTNRHNEPRDRSHPSRREDWAIALVECPDCEAPVDTRCITDNGQTRANIHRARLDAAYAAFEETLEAASRDVPPGGRR